MATWTTQGLNLIASAVQNPGVNCAMAYVALSTGCGTLASPGITAGTPITSIPLNAGLPAALAAGQPLTITDGANSETAQVASGGAALGATSIPITSWTPAQSYAANVTGIAPTPQASDTTLYAEAVRVAANPGTAGSNAGESLNTAYFDGTQPTAIYLLVGYFGGSSATGTIGSGLLMAADVQYWNHVANQDSNMYSADSTI
jgi:hypothetical protein